MKFKIQGTTERSTKDSSPNIP